MGAAAGQDGPEEMKEPMERMRWWELTFSIRGFENVTVDTLKLFWTVSLGSDNPKKHRNRALRLQVASQGFVPFSCPWLYLMQKSTLFALRFFHFCIHTHTHTRTQEESQEL